MVDARPAQAQRLFRQALDVEPQNEEAGYGYGYALLLQGQDAEATTWMCRFRNSSDPEIRQEVAGIVRSHALQCP